FHVLALVLRLRLLTGADVDHRCQNKKAFCSANRIQPDLNRKPPPLLPASKNFASPSHPPTAGIGKKSLAITGTSHAELSRNQRFDIAADQLIVSITKNGRGRRVGKTDYAL